MKFRSSMTLFEQAAEDPAPFAQALELFSGGGRDESTLALLGEGAWICSPMVHGKRRLSDDRAATRRKASNE